jgi:carbon-monoxide dehydrogenase large subunit
MTFPNGTQIAEVEIDRESWACRLVRHVAVEDYGVLVNPRVARGQAHGSIAQGAGQALMEAAVWEAESGQLLTGSFQDYALPRAADLPDFDLSFDPHPCTTNPLGVKGAGEAATGGIFPAIGNAILDALAPLGVTAFDGPATPARLWAAVGAAEATRLRG